MNQHQPQLKVFPVCSFCFFYLWKYFDKIPADILTDLSSTVIKGAQQFKNIVEEKTILGSFTKEQEKFVTDKRMQETRAEGGILPWIGYEHEEDLKKQILALSQVNINRKLSIKSIEICF